MVGRRDREVLQRLPGAVVVAAGGEQLVQRGLAVRVRPGDRGGEALARPHDLVAGPGPPLVEVGDDVGRRAGEVVELGGGGHPATVGRRGSGLGHPAFGVGQHGRDLVGEHPACPATELVPAAAAAAATSSCASRGRPARRAARARRNRSGAGADASGRSSPRPRAAAPAGPPGAAVAAPGRARPPSTLRPPGTTVAPRAVRTT